MSDDDQGFVSGGDDSFNEPFDDDTAEFNDNWSDAAEDDKDAEEETYETKTVAVHSSSSSETQHFHVLAAEGLDQERLRAERKVANLCGLDQATTAGLMRHYEWNEEKVIGVCLDGIDSARQAACISTWPLDLSTRSSAFSPETSLDPGGQSGFTCQVCFDDFPRKDLVAQAPCGHTFCISCWLGYFKSLLAGTAGGLRKSSRCMAHKCTCALPDAFIRRVLVVAYALNECGGNVPFEEPKWSTAISHAQEKIPELTLDNIAKGAFSKIYSNSTSEVSKDTRSQQADNLFQLWQTSNSSQAAQSASKLQTTTSQAVTNSTLSSSAEPTTTTTSPVELWQRWLMRIRRAYVDANRHMRWCPAPGCEYVIRRIAASAEAAQSEVQCACGHRMCFLCDAAEPHSPAPCYLAGLWRIKCGRESDAVLWIMNNTKPCPRCRVRIEKNQGCNHMTCTSCRYEFCWMCDGDWLDHLAKNGREAYDCNKFTPSQKTVSKGDVAAATTGGQEAQENLVRYLFYYSRYHANHMAQLFAARQRRRVEQRMTELQRNNENIEWSDVEFMREANEQVIESRRVLKFSYVVGFFLKEGKEKNLFEYLQQQLEQATELLSENVEREHAVDSGKLMVLARVSKQFAQNLVEGVERGLTPPDTQGSKVAKTNSADLYNTFGLDQSGEKDTGKSYSPEEEKTDHADTSASTSQTKQDIVEGNQSQSVDGQSSDTKSKKSGLFGWFRSG